MVSEYIDNICKYNLSKLENVVYLVGEEAVKSINIDNGAAYISSVSQEPIAIKCYNLKLTENESLDERYKFSHTVTFSVHGYANKDNFQDRYYVIVKDMDGTYWMLNPLFPCKVGYTYNLGYQEDHTDFTLATVSNHPVLEVKGLDLSNTFECRGYNIGGIDKLWLNEKRFTVHDGNSVKYTNDGFKEVDFKRTSGLLTETFDGDDISHSINFKIGFDYYKTSWQYNLLEFIDNIYASVVKTKEGKYTLCGFGYGLQPSYTINADDTAETPNIIDVTLTDAHSDNHTLEFYDSVDYEYLSAKTWEYTSMYGGYECVSEGMAKYLLKKETDALGNETDRYMALYGYEDRFADLNIVDTFYDEVLFSSVECGGMACLIDLSFPMTIRFNQIACKTYHLRCDTDWSITSSESFITVSPSQGVANQEYEIRVCNTIEPTATARTATLSVNYCSMTTQYEVIVEEGDDCFPQGNTYEISANAQTLTIPTKCCVEEVVDTASIGVITNVYGNTITVQVPENNSGRYRTITLLAIYCNGKSSNIIIRQSDVFESWVDDLTSAGTICVGYDEYRRQYKYTGQTSSSMTAKTDEYRDIFIMANSPTCGYIEPIYRWFDLDEYICSGTTKYHKAKKQVSYDNGSTWEDVIPIEYGTGTKWEEQSEDCGYIPPQYRYTSGSPYCISYDKYIDVTTEVSYDSGVTWEYVSTTPTLSEVDSTFCGVSYRWQPSGTTCVGYDKWEQSVKQKSYDGVSWVNVTPLTTSATTLIERNSEDCGYSPMRERWIKTSDMLCVGHYKVQYGGECAECDASEYFYGQIYNMASNPDDITDVSTGDCVKYLGCFGNYEDNEPYITYQCDSNLTYGSFGGLQNLSSVTLSNSIVSIGGYCFKYCKSLTTLIIPYGVKYIQHSAFLGCSGLTSITIPESVTHIYSYAFNKCRSLTSVTLPNSVEYIGGFNFSECSNLRTLTLGNNVRIIRWDFCWSSNNLESVTINTTTPPQFIPESWDSGVGGNISFYNPIAGRYNNVAIYVPSGSVNAYKAASGWSQFADKIYPIT